MNHIGNIIHKLRLKQGMSRKKLCENICSDKYLYMVEKGLRSPSTEIVRLLSIRLGNNLFEYYEFLDCDEPIQVNKLVNKFTMYRAIADFNKLEEANDRAAKLPDFKKAPWKYEIEVNNVAHSVFVDHKYEVVIEKINQLIDKIEPRYREEGFTANLYIMLSTCYQFYHNIEKSKEAILKANEILNNKTMLPRYSQIIISVKLNIMTLAHISGENDLAIEHGIWINHYQLETNTYERANFTYYYLAYAYYNKEMKKEAVEWFEKCLYELLIHYSPVPAYYISTYGPFYELFSRDYISEELINKIKKQYSFIGNAKKQDELKTTKANEIS